MSSHDPVGHVLERTAGYLSHGLSALEDFLSRVTHWFGRAIFRTARHVWQQLRFGFRNLRYLFGLAWVLLALAWIGSGFHEITFLHSRIAQAIGWLGVGVIVLIAVGGIVVMFSPGQSESTGSRVLLLLQITLVNAGAVLGIVIASGFHHELRSPLLKSAQSVLVSFVTRYSTLPSKIPSSTSPVHNLVATTSPSPLLSTTVHCKTVNGDSVAKSLDQEGSLSLWVDKIWLTDSGTDLDLAAKTAGNSTDANLKKATGAYFVDDTGARYELTQDQGVYSSVEPHVFGDNLQVRVCRGDEVCRFKLTFQKLTHEAPVIYLHHPQFERLEIDLDWQHVITTNE
jgi:hypothetical protein